MSTPDASPSGEDALIVRYFKPLATDPGAFNLGDDAAILKPSAEDLVLKTDAVVEGVHFLADDPPDTVARKALRRNRVSFRSIEIRILLRRLENPSRYGLGMVGPPPKRMFLTLLEPPGPKAPSFTFSSRANRRKT